MEKKHSKRLAFSVALFSLIIFILSSVAVAQNPITFRLGTIAPEGHPVAIATDRFAQLVNERTEGRIEILTYHGSVLGNETELTAAVGAGTIQMANVVISSGLDERLSLHYYLVPTMEHLYQRHNSLSYQEVLFDAESRNNMKVIASNWSQGFRHTIAHKPLQEITDYENVKLRHPPISPLRVQYYNALGAKPVGLGWNECYDGLQRGVVDAVEAPFYWLYSIRLHEVAKHLTLTGHILYNNGIIVNKNVWENNLSPAERSVIEKTAIEVGEWQNRLMESQEQEIMETMIAAGVTIHEVAPDVIMELVDLTEDVRIEWAESRGFLGWYERNRAVIDLVNLR